MNLRSIIAVSLLLAFGATIASARRRDPLTETEVDQLREAAQTPEVRIHLYVKFTRARMAAIEQLRGDPKLAEGRGKRIHDLLEDVTLLLDEIGANLDNYAGWDMRKSLKEVIEMDAEFQVKLRSIAEATDQASRAEMPEYRYVLQDTIEAVNADADASRQALDEQNRLAKDKKLKKPDCRYVDKCT